jgi:hypothetical protein
VITAPYDAALSRNAMGVPTRPMTIPASAGPAIRARLKMALLSAIALGMSRCPTISVTKVCRVGLSTTVTSPSANASR